MAELMDCSNRPALYRAAMRCDGGALMDRQSSQTRRHVASRSQQLSPLAPRSVVRLGDPMHTHLYVMPPEVPAEHGSARAAPDAVLNNPVTPDGTASETGEENGLDG